MEKTKELISLLLAGSMTFSCFGMSAMVTAEESKKTGVVFSEGFEEWDVGVIKDTAGNYTVGNLKFNLLENDKLEIAVNDYGNKALKITKGNTSSNTIRYVFPEQYSGEVNITFDFLSEHNSRYFSEFGNLEYNTNPNTMYKYTHYRDHLYVYGTTGTNILRNALSSTVHNGYVKFTTVYNTVDNASKTVSFGYERNKKSGSGDGDSESNMYSVNSSTSGTPSKIYGIRWVLGTKSGYSGTDTAASADDTINAGIYWIDNIVVSVDKPYISDTTLIAGEDFEGYTNDLVYNGGTKSWQGYFDINFASGDSVSIETDPVTNSKALKIVKGTSSTAACLDMSFGAVENKVVKLSYDVRFENHSRYLSSFPEIFDNSGNSAKLCLLYREQMYWDVLGSSNGGTVMANPVRNSSKKDESVKFEYTVDLSGGKIYSDITSSSAAMKAPQSSISKTSIDNIRFTLTNNANNGTDSDGTATNNGVYWIDNIRMEIVSLDLISSSIADGDTDVSASKSLALTFNEEVSANVVDAIMISKNADKMLEIDTDYTVSISDDSKTVTISPVGGSWDYESTYNVLISEVAGKLNIIPYSGTSISFVTGEYSNVLLNDYFENYTLGQKWEGPGDFITGNITLRLSEGDSVEYAYDTVAGINGFKLIKSNTDGELDFVYSFPGGYTDGKYLVKIDERVQNHSKGHSRWPALLSGSVSGEIQRMGLRSVSYWLQQTGSIGLDRYGVDHSSNTTSRYITGTTGNDRTTVFGELSTGNGIRFGVYRPVNNSYAYSIEPATTVDTLGGVLMRMKSGGTENNSDCYQVGTQKDTDTVNNPDNFGIAWIYGVTVERVTLGVTQTSFEDSFAAFNPENNFTVTFNEKLDTDTVNTGNIELYEGDNQISSYEYTVNIGSDGKTVTINPVAGIKYGTTYKINISNNVVASDSQIAPMYSDRTYTITTVEYEDTNAPDITWSSLPDGIENASPDTASVLLSTNGVYLDSTTINKDNIKVYENGTEYSDYTVEPSGLYSVKVNLGELKKESEYKITVTGLLSGGSSALEMTADFETIFKTRPDIYIDNVESTISADGTKSTITAELYNKTGESVNYQIIGVLKDNSDKIISVNSGTSGSVAANGVADVSVEALKDASAENFDLYIWDGLGTMKPLIKKAVLDSVNERTYGYDNYIDSSKPLNVSFIGGSITQQLQYTNPLKTSLNEFFKKDNEERAINYSIQGLGGTNSTLGLYRLEKDVINYNPDIVFIEFAVNDIDTSSEGRTKSMEGIIRKLMKLDHQPMIILLDVPNSTYKGEEVITDWEPLMTAYGIGYVNVIEYIKDNEATAENPDGLFVWREADKETYPNAKAITNIDGVHPTSTGGQIYADYMSEQLTQNAENYFKKMTYVQTPVSGYEYNNPRMVSWEEAEFDENWTVASEMSWSFYRKLAKAKSAGAMLTYKFTGTTIGLFVPKSKTGTTATYSIDDGAYTGTVSCNASVSTDMPMMSMMKTGLSEGEHTITISVDNADEINFRFGYFIVD